MQPIVHPCTLFNKFIGPLDQISNFCFYKNVKALRSKESTKSRLDANNECELAHLPSHELHKTSIKMHSGRSACTTESRGIQLKIFQGKLLKGKISNGVLIKNFAIMSTFIAR